LPAVESRESMHESPRIRRLRNDQTALERLAAESSIFHFKATGKPPYYYSITFKGKGLCRDRGKIKLIQSHQVEIKLGVSYPRSIPEIRWLTPIYHPNISEIGLVCLGGYGTHWVPSVQLDELCLMLWDMARFHNYDIRSPYNRDAALWVANQTSILFPTDSRPLRDVRVAQGRIMDSQIDEKDSACGEGDAKAASRAGRRSALEAGTGSAMLSAASRFRRFIEQYGRDQVKASNGVPEAAPSRQAEQAAPALIVPEVLDVAPNSAVDEPAIAAISADVDPVDGSHRENDEVLVLDTWTDPTPRPTPPAPGGDEIVFLD
jgi:hypothetical protein